MYMLYHMQIDKSGYEFFVFKIIQKKSSYLFLYEFNADEYC